MNVYKRISIFAIIITLLLVIWSLVSFWQRFFENLAFRTLEFDPTSTIVTFWLAISVTVILIFVVWLVKVILLPDVDIYLVGKTEESKGRKDVEDIAERGATSEGAATDIFSPAVLEGIPRIPSI